MILSIIKVFVRGGKVGICLGGQQFDSALYPSLCRISSSHHKPIVTFFFFLIVPTVADQFLGLKSVSQSQIL